MEKEMNDKLVKISTYAKKIDKSVTWVHKLIEKGELIMIQIDGVKFIKED